MTWTIILHNLIIVSQLLFTALCVWIHWRYVRRQKDKANVLVLLNFCLSVAHLMIMCSAVGNTLLFSNKVHLSLSGCILVVELPNFFVQLLFAITSVIAVLKLRLTFDFDRVHAKDPFELASTTMAIAVAVVLIPSVGITSYHLYKQEVVHPASNELLDRADKTVTGINLSVITIGCHMAVSLVLVVTAKLVAWWRKKRKMSQAVKAGEAGAKQRPRPDSGASSAKAPTADRFSLKSVIYGLGFVVIVVMFAVARNAKTNGSKAHGKENSQLLEALAVNTLLMLSGIHFSLNQKVWGYVKLRYRQMTASKFPVKRAPKPLRSCKVCPDAKEVKTTKF